MVGPGIKVSLLPVERLLSQSFVPRFADAGDYNHPVIDGKLAKY